MNRKLAVTVAVLLLACFLFYLLMVYSGNIARLNELTGNKTDIVRKAEPPFRKDGSLTFFNDNDSISTIQIEIAEDENAQSQGLMYRKEMKDNCGMLFIFNQSTEQKFWMKNTIIPLDIIYLDSLKTIVSINKYTKPFSEDMIPSGKPAQYVVEVLAGFCDEHKIVEGNTMKYVVDAR